MSDTPISDASNKAVGNVWMYYHDGQKLERELARLTAERDKWGKELAECKNGYQTLEKENDALRRHAEAMYTTIIRSDDSHDSAYLYRADFPVEDSQ